VAWFVYLIFWPLVNVVRIWRVKHKVVLVSDIWRKGPAAEWVPAVFLLIVLPVMLIIGSVIFAESGRLSYGRGWDYRGGAYGYGASMDSGV
jgi:hypothetical protein